MRTRLAGALLVTVIACTSAHQVLAANGNPGVIPPNAKYRGLSYGEWGAKWWQAAFAIPDGNGDHPIIVGGAFGGDKRVIFLAGVVSVPVEIHVTVPPGTALFFPVVNTECSVIEGDPFHGDNEEELRACANGFIDATFGLFAEIDGKPIQNLDAYRVESPLFEFGPLPEGNIFGAPEGTTSLSVDAGVYLLVPPLSPGTHEIRFGAQNFPIDTTYIITVEK